MYFFVSQFAERHIVGESHDVAAANSDCDVAGLRGVVAADLRSSIEGFSA
jgi:hypothetical protein